MLSVDRKIADSWGRIVARGHAVGHPIGPMDAFIAATAELHSLTLVTRNVVDFEAVLPDILDPWESG